MTPRLVMRPWQQEDFPAYLAMATDPEVMRYIGDGQPNTPELAEKRFASSVSSWDTHGFGSLAVELTDQSRAGAIGFAGLGIPDFLPEILPAVELGWRFLPDVWGRGYATEAAGTLLDWAFEQLDLDRLVSVIHQQNSRSQRVAQKLGMTVERRTVVPQAKAWVEVYQRLAPGDQP